MGLCQAPNRHKSLIIIICSTYSPDTRCRCWQQFLQSESAEYLIWYKLFRVTCTTTTVAVSTGECCFMSLIALVLETISNNMQSVSRIFGAPWGMWHKEFECPRFDEHRLSFPQLFDDAHNALRTLVWHNDQKIVSALIPGLDRPGKTHGDESLVPARPKAVPGVPRHFTL